MASNEIEKLSQLLNSSQQSNFQLETEKKLRLEAESQIQELTTENSNLQENLKQEIQKSKKLGEKLELVKQKELEEENGTKMAGK